MPSSTHTPNIFDRRIFIGLAYSRDNLARMRCGFSQRSTRSSALRWPLLETGAGLTQKQLARLLRKLQSFVSNYERGQRRIDVLELLRIVEALKADTRSVFMVIVARQAETKSRRK